MTSTSIQYAWQYLYLNSKHLSIGLPFPETTWNKNSRLHPGCHLLSFGSPPVWAPRTRRPNHCFHRISAASPPSPTKPSGSLIAHPLDQKHQLWCFSKLYLKPNLSHMSFVKRATIWEESAVDTLDPWIHCKWPVQRHRLRPDDHQRYWYPPPHQTRKAHHPLRAPP